MSNAIRCIDQRFCDLEFSYFVSGLDIQLEKSEYDSPVRKKIVCKWRNTTSHIPFFSAVDTIQWLETGCRESGDMGSNPEAELTDRQVSGLAFS